jgi:hypothetical protein
MCLLVYEGQKVGKSFKMNLIVVGSVLNLSLG